MKIKTTKRKDDRFKKMKTHERNWDHSRYSGYFFEMSWSASDSSLLGTGRKELDGPCDSVGDILRTHSDVVGQMASERFKKITDPACAPQKYALNHLSRCSDFRNTEIPINVDLRSEIEIFDVPVRMATAAAAIAAVECVRRHSGNEV
jgi:hypothetical protein